MKIRKAKKTDKKVLLGLLEFISSLKLEILKEGEEKLLQILSTCFTSEKDRFSYNYCTIVEKNNDIVAFSFSYHYDDVLSAKNFWFNNVVKKYNLNDDSIIFDYNEALENEFYLDTLYTFENYRNQGAGTLLLKYFSNINRPLKSLNVAQSNFGAIKLYESFGFKKDGEIFIGNEKYNHMIIMNK